MLAWIDIGFLMFTPDHWQEQGHRVARLRHCATSWKVIGSIPDGVIGILN